MSASRLLTSAVSANTSRKPIDPKWLLSVRRQKRLQSVRCSQVEEKLNSFHIFTGKDKILSQILIFCLLSRFFENAACPCLHINDMWNSSSNFLSHWHFLMSLNLLIEVFTSGRAFYEKTIVVGKCGISFLKWHLKI